MKRLASIASGALVMAAVLVASCAREEPGKGAPEIATGQPSGTSSPSLAASGVPHVGSARCMPCHVKEHAEWAASSHATTLRTATVEDEDMLASFVACSDLTVTHMLGDRHLKRFLWERPEVAWGQGRLLALPCAWDPHAKAVTMSHVDDWRELPFESSCAACHVTGFRATGEFLEAGVGCEECHAPGDRHVTAPSRENVYTFRNTTAAQEVTACASCHLQDGVSKRTGRKFPDGYVPGDALFDDFEFDWSVLDAPDPAHAIDVHQKLNIRNAVRDGDESLRCTSCHALHGMGHEKHSKVPKTSLCDTCHKPDMTLKEYRQSCNVCEF